MLLKIIWCHSQNNLQWSQKIFVKKGGINKLFWQQTKQQQNEKKNITGTSVFQCFVLLANDVITNGSDDCLSWCWFGAFMSLTFGSGHQINMRHEELCCCGAAPTLTDVQRQQRQPGSWRRKEKKRKICLIQFYRQMKHQTWNRSHAWCVFQEKKELKKWINRIILSHVFFYNCIITANPRSPLSPVHSWNIKTLSGEIFKKKD